MNSTIRKILEEKAYIICMEGLLPTYKALSIEENDEALTYLIYSEEDKTGYTARVYFDSDSCNDDEVLFASHQTIHAETLVDAIHQALELMDKGEE